MSLAKLKSRRARVKAQVTRVQTFLDSNRECAVEEAQVRLKSLEGYLARFEQIQQEIEDVAIEDDRQAETFARDNEAERTQFENKYYAVAAEAQRRVNKVTTNDKPLPSGQPSGSNQVQIDEREQPPHCERANKPRLPEIKLPSFNGEYTKWLFFKNSFETTVHNDQDLSGPQKFQYLVGVLTGEARQVVEGFGSGGYNQAWQLLQNTYDNEPMIIDTHLEELLNMPDVAKDEKADSMRKLMWHLQTHLSALKSLHQPVEHWDTLILHLAKRKLDYTEQRDWQNHVKGRTPQTMPKLSDFVSFITERCHTLRVVGQGKPVKTRQQAVGSKKSEKKIVLATVSSQCKICGEDHPTFRCSNLLQLSPTERRKLVMGKSLCLNCLKVGHIAKECKASGCKRCSRKHNTLLHWEPSKDETQEQVSTSEQPTTSVVAHSAEKITSEGSVKEGGKAGVVLLSTAQVYVQNAEGKLVRGRALLDSASQSNLITVGFLRKLGIPSTTKKAQLSGFEQLGATAQGGASVKIYANDSEFNLTIECSVLNTITTPIPQTKIDKGQILIPKGIKLADPSFDRPGNIDLLLGAGPYWRIVVGKPKNKISTQPALQNTKLGWILGGMLKESEQPSDNRMLACLTITNTQLHQQIEEFWKVETIPEARIQTMDEKSCESHFQETFQQQEDGRFIVRLPVRSEVKLGDSRERAQRRLESLERMFKRNAELKLAYCKFMKEYEDMGHMTQVTESALSKAKESYFIPHQAVVRSESLTTQLRVVFDASAKTTNEVSLNDKLLVGPNLQGDLLKILLRFRTHEFVITADIARMYRQILVDQRDRALQLILWREESETAARIYQLNTVTYGTASAPYQAMRCLLELAKQHHDEFPIASKIIQEDFYMDDVLTGGRTRQDVQEMRHQLFETLQRGQFVLRKWRSNEPEILKCLDHDDELFTISKDVVKTLGLLWSSTQDIFLYHAELPKQGVSTKRSVLSRVSQIFDPLGLVAPILIKGKILIQELWVEDLQWDEPLPTRYLSAWTSFEESIAGLQTLRVTRNVNPGNSSATVDLFGFGDASQRAIGACIYAVSKNENDDIQAHLVCAKSKVAPLKTLSLPRLELEAALLLANLYSTVKASMKEKIRKTCLWSDSTIVLGWLRHEPHTLKTFVANRVAKIQEQTDGIVWCHVPSEDNPADLVSRGVKTNELSSSELWWHGPPWLTGSSQRPAHMLKPESNLPEVKPSVVLLATTESFANSLLHRYSSFTKLCRVIAYCFRAVHKSERGDRDPVDSGKTLRPLHEEELEQAEHVALRLVQQEEFKQERQYLTKGQTLPRRGMLAPLNPFLDTDGLIRVGGRLRHASMPDRQKHQIILPAKHFITSVIMREEHIRRMHCPPEQLLHQVRQRYWPLRGRRLARKTVKGCVRCFHYNPTAQNVIMGDLPKERVTRVARPFAITGVDYAGPFQIRESRRRGRIHVDKGYIAVFVCFSTKAVHLEMVTTLTTDAFLSALDRFTARRGICSQIFSDNGTNFVGAARELKEIQEFLQKAETDISSYLAKQRIAWSFIPPRAPHFGGLWEAAVKMMKRHLYTATQGKLLTFEEYTTVLSQVEAILNSRPLTPMSDDPADLEVLTPAHFLIGDVLTQPAQLSCRETSDSHLSRWQQLRKFRQLLWDRWRREYLQELQKRNKWTKSDRKLEVGSVVLLMEDNLPTLRWPMGRVMDVHPGTDGQVRVVTVRTEAGCFKRAAKRVCPLPFNPECND